MNASLNFARRGEAPPQAMNTPIPAEQVGVYGLGLGACIIAGRWLAGLAKDDAEQKIAMRGELSELRKRVGASEIAQRVCESERKQMQEELEEIKHRLNGKQDNGKAND